MAGFRWACGSAFGLAVASAIAMNGAMAKPLSADIADATPMAVATAATASPAAGNPVAVQSAVGAAEAPACGRRVKVVYPGYGEADRAGCPSASVAAAR